MNYFVKPIVQLDWSIHNAFKQKEPKMKYDLKAMKFNPDSKELFYMFEWDKTPEGENYWNRFYDKHRNIAHLPLEPAAKIQAMKDQSKAELLPDIGVLHEHDGNTTSPVQVGTEITCWIHNDMSDPRYVIDNGLGWHNVTHYLVHAYPKPNRITGTIADYTDTPDFNTWVDDNEV